MPKLTESVERIGKSKNPRITLNQVHELLPYIANEKLNINDIQARALIKLSGALFKLKCLERGFKERNIRALTTKFRDAGRRSAPWRPASSKVPGRPQDGADGNRINRWLLRKDHKFYANEVTATFVEIKYMFQALSMKNAPDVKDILPSDLFTPWLLEHELKPNEYRDPVQLTPIDFNEFINDPRTVQSGHIFPLDRGGIHEPTNTFLMLSRSNQLQGNLTVEELLELMREITRRHDIAKQEGLYLENLIRKTTT